MIRFGLTGGIGSGKSTVAAFFRKSGYPCFDADTVAKELLDADMAVRAAIEAHFGAGLYADGKLDRAKLAGRAFSSPDKQAILNAIVHPAVEKYFQKAFKELEAAGELALMVEASMLFEADTAQRYTHIIVVTADESLRLERAKKRGFQSETDIRRRMAMQMPEKEKCRRAHDIILNNGSLSELESAWESLWGKLCGKYQIPPANPHREKVI